MKKILLFALLLFSVTTNAARFDVSSTAYQAGLRDISVANIVTTETRVTIEFTRDNWPVTGGELLQVGVYVSVRGGPFELICGMSTDGGDVINRDGSVATKSTASCSLPSGTVRLVNIRMRNTAPINTSISLIVE